MAAMPQQRGMPCQTHSSQRLLGSLRQCPAAIPLPPAHAKASLGSVPSPRSLSGGAPHMSARSRRLARPLLQTIATSAILTTELAVQVASSPSDAPVSAPSVPQPFTTIQRVPLAGGTLEFVLWETSSTPTLPDRLLRIWTPPGYCRPDAGSEGWPVLYLQDGQNLFDDRICFSGSCWKAAEAAAQLIESGEVPPFIIVGIDHSGPTRSLDYTPYKPGTGPKGFRKDAANWPGGGVDAYLERMVKEVMPYAQRAFGAASNPSLVALGGSSFGGICTLAACMRYPGLFGAALVESPSLWIGEERFLFIDIATHRGPWPDRMFIGMGGQEYSGIRPKQDAAVEKEFDQLVAGYAPALEEMLKTQGVTQPGRLCTVVEPNATHNEASWAKRLPGALKFLLGSWWGALAARHDRELYFTVPQRLRAGQTAALVFNRARSGTLSQSQQLRLVAGFNEWQSKVEVPLTPLPAAALAFPARSASSTPQPTSSATQSASGSTPLHSRGAGAGPSSSPGAAPTEVQRQPQASSSSSSSNGNGSGGTAQRPSPNLNPNSNPKPGPAINPDLFMARFTIPPNAYEMVFAFREEGSETWDSNAGANFYARVSLVSPATARGTIALTPHGVPAGGTLKAFRHHYQNPAAGAAAGGDGGAVLSVDELARKNKHRTYFTYPERLTAGSAFTLYVNRARSDIFRNCPNVKMTYGWNNWQMGSHWADLKPTNLWRSESEDWWGVQMQAPDQVQDIHFCFTDGAGNWDSNGGNNYVRQVAAANKAAVDAAAAAAALVKPRGVAKEERLDHAGGHLHVLTLSKRDSGTAPDRNSKWTEEKVIRVWTPPGYDSMKAPDGGWPVLVMNDAQNKFECWLAHQGVSWRIGYTASELIARGDVPPFVIVGIDNPGPMRSLNYLPYPPGTGAGGFRGDAERWPGGGVEQYMNRVIYEVLPMVTDKFNLATDPSRVAFGGGSFGGVNALYVAMHYPHIFGAVLAESPSLWIAEGRFLEDMWSHTGMLPERVFMGCGTKEYSATRDHVRDDVDALLLHYYHEAARALESKGLLPGNGRLRFLVEEGAGHHELAWQWRLTGALQFLLGPWKA